MNFTTVITQQIMLHPAFAPQDAGKLCYQAAFGAEHLLNDPESARRMFFDEFEAVTAPDIPLFEIIGEDYARVNLAAWKQAGLSPDSLFTLFEQTANTPTSKGRNHLESLVADVAAMCWQDMLPFDEVAWQYFVADWQQKGYPPVRHSTQYREKEQPAYRVVRRELLQAFDGSLSI